MNLLVTGSASGLAQVLLPRLLADPRVELVIGVDREQGAFTHERFVQVLMDLHSPLLERVLKGARAVVHLAAAGYVEPAPAERAAAQAAMLRDAQNLFTRAAAAGVPRLVHLSSALVYDARGGGALHEDHARGGGAGCGVAQALRAVEDWLDGFEREHPNLRLLRLRPHWIVGPRTGSLLKRLLTQRLRPRLPDPQPVLQCVHEDDVAAAIALAIDNGLSGALNLACAEAVTLHDMQRLARRLTLPASPRLVARRLDGAEAGCLKLLEQPLVLDTDRARRELGWTPRYDRVRDALRRL